MWPSQFVKYVLIQCKTDCMNCGLFDLFIESGRLQWVVFLLLWIDSVSEVYFLDAGLSESELSDVSGPEELWHV